MSSLPSGTVTFLFTDIEGSTRLAQEYPNEMLGLLARHHELLRQAIQNHSGYAFQSEGDSFAVAFHTAGDALGAASEAQRLLQSEAWSPAPVKVRMGIHAGAALLNERSAPIVYSAYATLAITQRIMSAGHGGQVLVSAATKELLFDDLPQDVSLLDLGERRLKDLVRPQHIYQLVIPGLPVDFPPLKTLDAYRHNLPVQLTSFIGREKEIEEVRQAILTHKLVTLTGVGGTGKTRLALQVAAEVLDSFPDGVWFVDLTSLVDPALIPQTILSTLDLPAQNDRLALDVLADYLSGRRTLILLDNCEHLLLAASQTAAALLQAAPDLKVLATSREALGVPGEVAWPVPSLSAPDPERLADLNQLTQYESVRLFVERAALVNPHFDVTAHSAPAIAQICHRLDGIPLALELAAARVKMLSVDQISARLDDRFRLLTGGARTALPRQQTLRSMIDWSYDLLADTEKLLLRRLAVFAGGWPLESAEQVCSDEKLDQYEILDMLGKLVDKSLVAVVHNQVGARYRMLETIRQYAREKLLESGEETILRDRHLQFFLKLAEEAKPNMRWSDAIEWHDRIDADHDNFRLALDWARRSEHMAESGLRLVDALSEFWLTRGWLVEGREQSASALMRARSFERSALYANVLCDLGWYASFQGDFPAARAFANESLTIFRELGDKLGISNALQVLGTVAIDSKDYVLAEATLQEALRNRRELTDAPITSLVATMGWAAFGLGDYALARQRLNEALKLSVRAENKGITSGALQGLAEVDLREGRYESASKLIEESLAIQREIGDKWRVGAALGVWAWIALLQHDWDSAFSRLKQSTAVRKEIGDKGGLVWCLEKFGQLAYGKGDPQKAAKILGAAASIRIALGSAMDPFDQADYEESMASLREQLGEEMFNKAWAEGEVMSTEAAIKYALDETHG